VRVAAVQLNSTADPSANLASADRLTRAAAADGAKLIVLPEKWTAIGSDEQQREAAETLDGPAIAWARALARELEVDLVAGSILERVPGHEKLANTSVHVDPQGEVRASYRKLHMFDVEVAGRSYRESDIEEPGEEIVTSETADGVELGLSICYDLRFPELYRILAVRGARILTVPAAFTLATTRDHWETLLRARAIENQAFVIAANQVGAHPAGQDVVYWIAPENGAKKAATPHVFHLCQAVSPLNGKTVNHGSVTEAYAENATRITKQIPMEQKQCGFGAATSDKTAAPAAG